MKERTRTRLKDVRLERGKKQSEVAEALGITVPAYSMIENGQRDINSDKLIRLARYYGCSTDELLGSWYWHEVVSLDD